MGYLIKLLINALFCKLMVKLPRNREIAQCLLKSCVIINHYFVKWFILSAYKMLFSCFALCSGALLPRSKLFFVNTPKKKMNKRSYSGSFCDEKVLFVWDLVISVIIFLLLGIS